MVALLLCVLNPTILANGSLMTSDSAAALFFWLYYLSMHTGWPERPLANLKRLAEGFHRAGNMGRVHLLQVKQQVELL